jgi:hypothetical protein
VTDCFELRCHRLGGNDRKFDVGGKVELSVYLARISINVRNQFLMPGLPESYLTTRRFRYLKNFIVNTSVEREVKGFSQVPRRALKSFLLFSGRIRFESWNRCRL